MSFARSLRRKEEVRRVDRVKKNTRGKVKGLAQIPSLKKENSKTTAAYLPNSIMPEGKELPEPSSSCKRCYGLGYTGNLEGTALVCTCIVKQLDLETFFKEEKKEEENEES